MRYQKGKVKKKIPFKIIFKNLGINLTKEVKDVYTENYKTLIIKDDSKRWKDIPYSWIERINTTQTTYRFNVIPIKLPMTYSTELVPVILKYKWKHKRPRIANIILKKQNKAGGIVLPDLENTANIE